MSGKPKDFRDFAPRTIALPFVCFPCRRSYKRRVEDREWWLKSTICPECAGRTVALYHKFKPPPRRDVAQWEKARALVAAGFRFCSDDPPYPESPADLKSFLAREKQGFFAAMPLPDTPG